MSTIKLVILDRDGSINQVSDEYIKAPAEWQAIPSSLEAVARLNHAGWHVVLATNQSGLGRGLFEVSDLNAIHSLMHQQLAELGGRVDAVFYCPHTPDEQCHCRKPQTGLLEQIAERYGTSLQGVPMIGDSQRDMVAGAAMGCEPHLVLTGRGAMYQNGPLPETFPTGTRVHRDLSACVDFLLARAEALSEAAASPQAPR
jgi:D-glycero-D-manno-heptose 1,7-bisphosphate phosphatase